MSRFELSHLGDAEPTMTAATARELFDEVKDYGRRSVLILLRIHNEGGWKALGYSSWGHACRAEYNMGYSTAYQMIAIAKIWEQLPAGTNVLTESDMSDSVTPKNNRVVGELVPAMREGGGEAVREAWREAVERHGPQPTSRQVKEVVQRRHSPPPAPKPEPRVMPWRDLLDRLVVEAAHIERYPDAPETPDHCTEARFLATDIAACFQELEERLRGDASSFKPTPGGPS